MDNQQPTSSGVDDRKMTKKGKVFQYSWLSSKMFKDWLKPHGRNDTKALCTACNKVLSCRKSDLERHSRTKQHEKNISKGCNITSSESSQTNDNLDLDHVNKVKIAEIKLAAFYAKHDIAFETLNQMVPLLKEICSDPQVVNDLKLPQSKCSKSIENVIDKPESNKLIAELKSQKFSVLIDESTTISNDKLLCILVKYISSKSKKCNTQLFEQIQLDARDCSAEKLYSAFKNCFESKNIPLTNIVGMACDNAPVTIDIRDSFVRKLKEEVPALIVLKCIRHSSALIASKACAKLPDSCENVLHAIGTYCHNSAKQSAILQEFQQLFEVESRKIVKLSGTRWLVLEKCVTRLVDNWEVLQQYFYLEAFENQSNSATSISDILNNNETKAYMLFLKYSLNFFNDFNALFQGRKILIHKLVESSEQLMRQMGSDFLLPQALKSISVDSINSQNFLPLNSVYVGPECESFLQSQSEHFITDVKSKCLSFYLTAFQEMLNRLPYNDDIFRELRFLDASIALCEETRLTFPDLMNVARSFQIPDITSLAYEWRMLPIVFDDEDKSILANLDIDDMWKTIFEKRNFNDEPLFPNLEMLVQAVLCLPYSNAEAERICE